ncbi:hypothetical protein HOLleu_28786 [Holothuria leucospilota]|uniref:Uncharacterized protein n=1 Tax=Holothuria leucospilota TaxID=206669 RepID=A0A9Q1BMX4_HOLLE|nr:hypothetical protein HOLleu_28786 [Holothuria leucospilota]
MDFRVLLYCVVFLRLSLSAKALKCYTQVICEGDLCGGSFTTSNLEETTCPSDLNDVCLSLRLEYTVNGERIESTMLGCSADYGVTPGCFNIHELPSSVTIYQDSGYDTFEYCLCDQDLCNNNINFVTNNNGNGNNNDGNNNAEETARVLPSKSTCIPGRCCSSFLCLCLCRFQRSRIAAKPDHSFATPKLAVLELIVTIPLPQVYNRPHVRVAYMMSVSPLSWHLQTMGRELKVQCWDVVLIMDWGLGVSVTMICQRLLLKFTNVLVSIPLSTASVIKTVVMTTPPMTMGPQQLRPPFP